MSTENVLVFINVSKFESIAKIEDFNTRVYRAAVEYALQGFYVIPLRINEKILPKWKFGINYGSATNKTKTIDKWFNPENGKFRGHNIGIATGKENGVFAVDVDMHEEINGFKTLELLEKENGVLSAPTQTTPRGGKHFLFKWQENLISSTSKLGSGIDTRGGEEKACKAHIVVFPSIVEGGKYTWVEGGEVPFAPDWIINKMGTAWRVPTTQNGPGRGNENVSQDDEEEKIPEDQIIRMLGKIDPNSLSYDEWLRVGQAINTQYPDEKGLEIWDSWSSNGKKYKKGECHVRWKSFSPNGQIRIGSLFYYARQNGWEPEQNEIRKGSLIDEIIERMNSDHAVVVIGGKVKILRELEKSSDPTTGNYDLMGVGDFKTLMDNNVVFIKNKPVKIANIWLACESRRTYPGGVGLFPDGIIPRGYYNVWKGFSVEPIKGDCEIFLHHMRNVICNGSEQYYNWLIDWCADLVQNPANPKGTAVVMRGMEGVGKGTLANFIGELFGPHYRHLIDDSHLLSNFNAHMIDALFVFADEITWGGNKKTSGKLKGIVTEKYLVGERKGIDAVGYRNMIRMMIASNGEWVVPAGTNSRRWFVLDVPPMMAGDTGYFHDIKDRMENGGKEALLYFLLNKEIKSDLRKAPHTHALLEQRQRTASDDSVLQWWSRTVEMEVMKIQDIDMTNDDDWPKSIIKQEMYNAYEFWCIERRIRPEINMVFHMKIQSYGLKTFRPMIQNVKRRAYRVPGILTAKKILNKNFNFNLEE